MSDPGGCLHLFLPELLRAITIAVDDWVTVIRGWLGDRGCFAVMVSSALLVLVLAAVLGLDWGLWLALAGVLVLSVVMVGGRYRLGAGRRSESGD